MLDIRVKEPSIEALCRGKKEYEPARFMSVNVAAQQLIEIEEKRAEGGMALHLSVFVYGIAALSF